ncbi:MAG: gluconate 2-dehydrogenase subunit 3 family protein [Rhodothermales bacterium]|nr:gluconate 2-dehydrogenase subunit 3 family protein [Rhodothermales bacterium]
MNRREAIERLGLLMGGALSMSTVAGLMGGCRVGPREEAYAFQTLQNGHDELVATVSELIIPETDTPGARAARVHEFIDRMLTGWYEPRERDHFLAGLADLDRRAQAEYAVPFLEATPEQQTALLAALEAEAIAHAEARQEAINVDEFGRDREAAPGEQQDELDREQANMELERQEVDADLAEAPARPFFAMIKELTLAGYYTSEIGATQELRDMPFGSYNGDIPFEDVGRAWA